MVDTTMILDRLTQLRLLMKLSNIDVFLVNGSDPHSSEYVQGHWESRRYLSGFTGSYGWMAITAKNAALWTDSRYFIQAEQELSGTGITLEKARLPETISVGKWIVKNLNFGRVGFDGMCYSYSEVEELRGDLGPSFELDSNCMLLDRVWQDRPTLYFSQIYSLPFEFFGESRNSKIARIRKTLKDNNADTTVLTALDEIAWTFNLRSSDIDFNPVLLSYAIVESSRVMLFAEVSRIPETLRKELLYDGVEMFSYSQFYDILKVIIDKKVLVDPQISNYNICNILEDNNCLLMHRSVVQDMKAVKNKTEIEGIKKAMLQDGIALLDFHYWLEKVQEFQDVTEFDLSNKLYEFRSKQPDFVSESFNPIVAFSKNGAIVHYHVYKETALPIDGNSLLLMDSGGQYKCGTTDITRTILVGEAVDPNMKRDFTLVLKGMIALSQAHFPKGTCGCHLDILAKKALWKYGLNYGHGTSHGVGAFLNVHEGPESVRSDFNNTQIVPGMVISDEPGVYFEGKYGIRIENMIYCTEDRVTDFGDFYKFETLTLFPIDLKLVDADLLDADEIEWLNKYHETVYEKLSACCSDPDKLEYLRQMCQQIEK